MLTILPFGGCTVNNPILNLQKRGLAKPVFKQIGFKRTPYALSPNALIQLYKHCTGKIEIPTTIRKLNYVDSEHIPTGELISEVHNSDVMLIEISTPFDIVYEGFFLNHNRLNEVILSVLPENDISITKLVNRWKKAMMAQKQDVQTRVSQELLPMVDSDAPDGLMVMNILKETRCEKVDQAGIAKVLDELLSLNTATAGLVLHNFCYMPDGRPVVWPADLNDTLCRLAKERNIPVFDPSQLVSEHGTEIALASDLRHWSNDFYPVIADAIFTFMSTECQRFPVSATHARDCSHVT